MTPLFCTLDSQHIAKPVRTGDRCLCCARPGLKLPLALALSPRDWPPRGAGSCPEDPNGY